MDKIEELLTRGVANIIPNKDELKKVLESDGKLNIYFGIDPTMTKIHLGHAVPLRKLQQFADLGHRITFLIGDYTALVGDTSDKESERPILTPEEIEQNFQTYKDQAERVLDFTNITLVHNKDWLKSLPFDEIIKLLRQFSVNDFISRELIRKRLTEGKRVRLDEVLYPIMQGYDSYHLDTDVQIGGTDQTFNMQAGRTLQKILRHKESFILASDFLTGTDGRKMSKTWGNAVWIEDSPDDKYSKIMAIHDSLIVQYYTLATNTSLDEIANIKRQLEHGGNPMNMKKQLAFEIVKQLNTEADAIKAQEHFEKTVQHKELPIDIPVYMYTGQPQNNVVDLLIQTNLATSRNEAKRLIEQSGVEIDSQKITDTNATIEVKNGMIIKVGKRRIVRISK